MANLDVEIAHIERKIAETRAEAARAREGKANDTTKAMAELQAKEEEARLKSELADLQRKIEEAEANADIKAQADAARRAAERAELERVIREAEQRAEHAARPLDPLTMPAPPLRPEPIKDPARVAAGEKGAAARELYKDAGDINTKIPVPDLTHLDMEGNA